MTTFFERPEDYLGETVTAELPTVGWFFNQFPQEPQRPRGYKGTHRWNVRRRRRTPRGGEA